MGVTLYLYESTASDFQGASLDFNLLAFAVVTPISASIGMAFTRRDRALTSIAKLRATALKLYESHAKWNFGFDSGDNAGDDTKRTKSSINWLDHSDRLLGVLLQLFRHLTRYLTLPTSSRARHRVTGQKEARELGTVSDALGENMVEQIGQLSDFCEIMKREGLPPQEAIRIRQWERFLLTELETLRMIKQYRTPQGLRSFGRLFSVFLPPFYAPVYVQTARDLNSLGVGIAFACLTSVALTTLFETVFQMEDPFVIPSGLDGIRVDAELLSNFKPRALRCRKEYFPQAPPFEQDVDTKPTSPSTGGQVLGLRVLNE